jgi:hypothetical protein
MERQVASSYWHLANLFSILGIKANGTNARKGLYALGITTLLKKLEAGSNNLVDYTISIYT